MFEGPTQAGAPFEGLGLRIRSQRRVLQGDQGGPDLGPGTGCEIEPLAQCCIDRRMVEEIEVVEPPEVARVLDGKGDVPAITGLAVGTVGLDEKSPTNRPSGLLWLVVTVALIA